MDALRSVLEFIKTIFKREVSLLWIFGVFFSFSLIILDNLAKLPLGAGDFIFFAIIALLVSLYKPRWVFFLFIMFLPLENIILSGDFLPFQLRPYQFVGAILVFAVSILALTKKHKFFLIKPIWIDWLVFSLVPLSFLALINSPDKNISLKNNLVLISFVFLYFLVRNFLKKRDDFIKTFIFFVGSFFTVATYGFYQVLADKFGLISREVMFGRPNATFTEPDWLGIFLCFSLAAFFAAINYFETRFPSWSKLLYLLIFFNLMLLILTVSRSAWLGAIAVIFVFLLGQLFKKTKAGTKFNPARFSAHLVSLMLVILVSILVIFGAGLTKFDILDRARSTTSSEQKITVACNEKSGIPQFVMNNYQLQEIGCRHINLEDIDLFKAQGKYIAQIYRNDPNFATRSRIYEKSYDILKAHPIAGVGFGTITKALGVDERGTGLNESNLFLQIWAGCGILGIISFIMILVKLFIYAFRRLSPICPLNKFFGCPVVRDDFERSLHIFAILALLALIIPNLFNAGLFMGIFWLGLATIISAQNLDSKNIVIRKIA